MGIYRGVTSNQQADTYRAVCFGKYLGSFTEITQAAIAVDDYRMSNGGKWKDLNFHDRYPKPPEKPKRRFTKPVRDVDEQTRRLWYLFSKVRFNADLRKIEFAIEREDLVELWEKQTGKCAITGRQMTLEKGKGSLWSAASVDRIDNKIGYHRLNIHLVCVGINRAKGILDLEEFIKICGEVVKFAKDKNTVSI